MHFLFHCTFYDDLRISLFDKVIERHGLFANFDYHEKVLFLFNNADPHISRLTAAFVFRAMEKRRDNHYTTMIYKYMHLFIDLFIVIFCLFYFVYSYCF